VLTKTATRLVRQTPLRRECIKPGLSKHMRGEGERTEQIGKRGIADVQAAGGRPEGRHHHPRRIGSEAAAAHRTAAMRHARDRMQMAADVACGACRQMAKRERAKR